ncbi:dihydroorotase [Thermospira aquatica]|uniref:Dihydroorotase n=1 Tax=Thermospira aquatica TaxID=2828656 RepID=A0AAX3BFV5_9SPIR|nr:dihydroorotase [Thermospira aquatica]URA11287.1 dihydroorotase [Thermospira aquatica]
MILSGGIVCDPVIAPSGKRLDVWIENGRIKKIARNIQEKHVTRMDIKGKRIYPGFVDMHVHLREPGQTHKEDMATATRAAAAGGVTTVLAMPNTIPPIDRKERYQEVMSIAREKACIEVLQACAMTVGRKGEKLTDFESLKETGCLWLSDDGSSIQDQKLLFMACERLRLTGQLWVEHPEIALLAMGKPLHDGSVSRERGWQGQPREAESLAVLQAGLLAGLAGVRVHFTHLSSWQSVEAVRMLKRWYPGLITSDTAPHYLLLTEEDVKQSGYDPNKKMNPPLRKPRDRQALLDGLLDGTIDCVASDHAPHTQEEKAVGIEKAPFGVVGVQTLFSALVTLAKKQNIPSKKWLPWITLNPARILGIDRGRFAPGMIANLTIVDQETSWEVSEHTLFSRSHNSAFLGMRLDGRVLATYAGGKLVYEVGK